MTYDIYSFDRVMQKKTLIEERVSLERAKQYCLNNKVPKHCDLYFTRNK